MLWVDATLHDVALTMQRHSLTVQPKKKLSSHVDYDLAKQCFSKHFGKGLSFSTTPLEVSGISVCAVIPLMTRATKYISRRQSRTSQFFLSR